jgi:SAM-dependent methyltransferase
MSDRTGVQSTATREGADPPSLREDDAASVARYLLSFDWFLQNREAVKSLVGGGLPLWLEILRLVPQRQERGRLLELGSPPFFITLLLQKFRNYDMSLTAAAADGRPRLENTVASLTFGEEYHFDCVCFDLERDPFPFADSQFDVVTWCEVIEHLTENPVFTLSEIHRVLKPGGAVVISTPNVARIENVIRVCFGNNVYDPYHLGTLLHGSRHSREYTLAELRDLVSGCGFRAEVAEDRDLPDRHITERHRWIEAVARLVMRFAPGAHRDHLFVRAVKEGPFHWAFPPDLFDYGHLLWYLHVCDREVVMGHNDVPHTSIGWGPLETGPEGKAQRRAGPTVDAYLISHVPVQRVVLEMCGGGSLSAGTVEVWQGEGDLARRLAVGPFEVPPHRWSRFDLPLGPEMRLGERIKVRIAAPSGVDVHRVALES